VERLVATVQLQAQRKAAMHRDLEEILTKPFQNPLGQMEIEELQREWIQEATADIVTF